MITVEILKEGYSFLDEDKEHMIANCTCSLIKENNIVVLVDTLTAWDASFLTEALKERGLKAKDITHVVGTHGHSDHIGNLNMFTDALHIVGQSISHKDKYWLQTFNEDNPFKISENIEIIVTPGHTLSDVSVLVHGTDLGIVAVVGDLFERKEDISDPMLWSQIAGSENPDLQYKNRTKILQLVDYIIPGHGPGFKVTDELKKTHKKHEN